MLSKKKKIIILCTMVALLVVTGYLNIMFNNQAINTSTGGGDETQAAGFFITYRADRTQARTEAIAYYDAIISSASSSSEAKTLAETKKAEIVATMTLELNMEGLIKAKGFEDVIASCSDSYINILVKSAELTEVEVAQIVEVVQSQTQKDIDYIKIIPVET
ncbi:MAG: SpoIIIAH-like family protein [Christensenellaceae bacterium]|jgi:stage III sporulation protein AH|nr:SpoIIIAH-like family protein [Christensenellaceae bacterium]